MEDKNILTHELFSSSFYILYKDRKWAENLYEEIVKTYFPKQYGKARNEFLIRITNNIVDLNILFKSINSSLKGTWPSAVFIQYGVTEEEIKQIQLDMTVTNFDSYYVVSNFVDLFARIPLNENYFENIRKADIEQQKFEELVKQLEGFGISIKDEFGNFYSAETVLKNISQRFNTLFI